jgi:hypothetical protein
MPPAVSHEFIDADIQPPERRRRGYPETAHPGDDLGHGRLG